MLGKQVLIIDDDKDLLHLAGLFFKKAGAEVVTALDGLEGISKLLKHTPHLIVLDVMLPRMDGFEICRRIRQVSDIPIIMLTSLNQDKEMLMGLEAGADDFLSKPFNPDILLARAKAVVRRSESNHNHKNVFEYNDGYLNIDVERHQISVKDKRIKLSPMEFRLLIYLARNAGKTLTTQQILTNVWGAEYRGSIDYVHVYISHLRNKIEQNAKSPRYIITVHGVGYIFEKQELVYKT